MGTPKTDIKPSRYDTEYNLQHHNNNANNCIKPIRCDQCAHHIFNCTGRTKQ